MARRAQRTAGQDLWRRAALTDMRRQRQAFPTELLVERISTLEAGGALEVSGGRLFRGLLLLGERATAENFSAVNGRGSSWFVIGNDDTLTEVG